MRVAKGREPVECGNSPPLSVWRNDQLFTARSGQGGFILLLAVLLLAFVVLLLVALATLTRVETLVADNLDQAARARQDALMALNVALGQLQRHAGPDARVTSTAVAFGGGEGTRHYTGVWDGASSGGEPLTWLVSGNERDRLAYRPTTATTGFVELLGHGTTGAANAVLVPLQTISVSDLPGQPGPVPVARYAWWVEDLGVKASLAMSDRSTEVTYGPWSEPAERQRLRQRIGSVPTWMDTNAADTVGFDPWHPANRTRLERILAQPQIAWLEPAGVGALPASLRDHYHDFTPAAHGVLANSLPPSDPARGLWRDLSLAPELLGPAFEAYASLDYVEPASATNDALPPITSTASPRRRVRVQPPVDQAGVSGVPALVTTTAPVLSEFLLQFRVDRVPGGVELRSRLYVGLWNPYTSALVPPQDLKVVVSGLPTITVGDADADAQVEIDLQAAPFGPWDSSVSLPFTEGDTPQTDRRSWLPGRMYSWVTRELSNPPADLEFYKKALTTIAGWTIGVRPLAGTSENLWVRGAMVEDLVVELRLGSTVVATYRPPPYPEFFVPDVAPDAEPTTSRYWRFAYGFRLNQASKTTTDRSWLVSAGRDPRALTLPPESIDPFHPLGSFDPSASVYVGSPKTADGLSHLLIYRVQGTGLSTRSANYDAPVFELPRQPLLSLGELQHLHVDGQRPFSIGNPWGGALNALFDRYFFSGLSPAGPGPDLAQRAPLPNWNLLPVDSRGTTDEPFELSVLRGAGAFSSRFLLQRGAFNVNSTSAAAWRAVFSSVRFPAELMFVRADIDNGPLVTSVTGSQRTSDAVVAESFADPAWAGGAPGPAFFRFPQTAQETHFWSSSPSLTSTEMSRQPFRQGVRGGTASPLNGLSAAQVGVFAQRIADLVRVKHAASGPFRSLAEFVNPCPELGGRSVFDRAIDEAALNPPSLRPLAEVADVAHPGLSSLTLTQADVLTAIAPYLRNRSDTFAIRAYAESLNPATGAVAARAWGEAVVQRIPDPVDPEDSIDQPAGPFGRRFQIISFRWLSPAEI